MRKIIARWLAACQAGGRVPQLPSLVVNCGTDPKVVSVGVRAEPWLRPSGRVNMPCFHPLRAFRSSEVHEKSGKHKIIFNPDSRKALIEEQPALMLPCGQCIGCRSDKAQAMGQRCGHEQKMHEASCFYPDL